MIVKEQMKILRKSQKYFAVLGFGSEQSAQKYHMNWKLLMGSILIAASLVFCVLYLILIAKTFDKYIESICTTMAIFVIGTCFVSMVFGMDVLIECIDDIEDLIETSKLTNSFYLN